jgi:hypothetical protein
MLKTLTMFFVCRQEDTTKLQQAAQDPALVCTGKPKEYTKSQAEQHHAIPCAHIRRRDIHCDSL